MSPEFFMQQMEILTTDFGSAEYTPTRNKLIWEYCKDLPDYNFGRIIRHFLDTKPIKYPPLPTHFHEAALEQKKLLEQQGLGKTRSYLAPGEYSNTPIKEIMKKLGGESAVEALEKQIQKSKSMNSEEHDEPRT